MCLQMTSSVLGSGLTSPAAAPNYLSAIGHMEPPPPSKSPIEPASLGGQHASSADAQATGKIGVCGVLLYLILIFLCMCHFCWSCSVAARTLASCFHASLGVLVSTRARITAIPTAC